MLCWVPGDIKQSLSFSEIRFPGPDPVLQEPGALRKTLLVLRLSSCLFPLLRGSPHSTWGPGFMAVPLWGLWLFL